jgi:hypothetical protein
MAKLNVGFNFTQEHFDVLMELLEEKQLKSRSQIWGIYGSPGTLNPFGSVRETYREKTPDPELARSWLRQLGNNGIEINFTLNSLIPRNISAPLADLNGSREAIIDFMDYWDYYVDNWVVAHPGIIDFIHRDMPIANIIVSTIMNVHTLPQVQWIADNWPQVVRICPAIEKNRDFMWLRTAQSILPMELLANEFCSMGGTDCEGLYRQACYMTQSLKLGGWCARDACIAQRNNNPIAWLQSRFILPQWMPRYCSELGIEHFKVTGRTHTPEYLKYIAETYMSEHARGNLLSLWGQLEATKENVDQAREQEAALADLYIPIGIFDDFSDYDRCHADVCGRLCKKCKKLVEYYHGFQRTSGSGNVTKKDEETESPTQ